MWNLSRPGIEPKSPSLAAKFLVAGPPGKSYTPILASLFTDPVTYTKIKLRLKVLQCKMSLTILSYQTDICGEDQVALGNRMEETTLNTVITAIKLIKVR